MAPPGATDRNNAQPIVVNHCKGSLALAHNGNLVNSFALREELELTGSIFHTTSDTEVISYVITKERLSAPSIEEAVDPGYGQAPGCLLPGGHVRHQIDGGPGPRGFRPLCYGQTADGAYIVASESCALDAAGASFIRDVEPGEIVVFDGEIVRSIRTHCGQAARTMCVFEYISLCPADSVMDGSSVHKPADGRGCSWPWSIRWRRMWWWACRIPALTPPSVLPRPPAFPMAWA